MSKTYGILIYQNVKVYSPSHVHFSENQDNTPIAQDQIDAIDCLKAPGVQDSLDTEVDSDTSEETEYVPGVDLVSSTGAEMFSEPIHNKSLLMLKHRCY